MISVVIPTYNRQTMLAEALASVYAQTLQPSEVLVIDDGSTDQTAELVRSMAGQTSLPVRYFRQPNRGPAAARNVGIKMAKGPYLAFLDSDDCWEKQKLATQFQAMRSAPDFLISHTRETWYRRGVRLNQKKIHQPPHGMIFTQCLRLCCVAMSTVLADKRFFMDCGWFDESLRCCEDYDLWLRGSRAHPFLLVDEPLTIKRGGRTDQVSVCYRQGMDRFRIQALARLLCHPGLSENHRRLVRDELKRRCLIYGDGCSKHGRTSEGSHYGRLIRWAEQARSHA